MKKLVTAALLASFLPSGIAAQTYICDMNNKGRGGWIGDKMLVALDRGKIEGFVYDGAMATAGKKTAAKVDLEKRSDMLWVFRWSVKNVNISNDAKSTVTYRAMLNVQTNRVTMSGRLHGFDNQISGSGKCKAQK